MKRIHRHVDPLCSPDQGMRLHHPFSDGVLLLINNYGAQSCQVLDAISRFKADPGSVWTSWAISSQGANCLILFGIESAFPMVNLFSKAVYRWQTILPLMLKQRQIGGPGQFLSKGSCRMSLASCTFTSRLLGGAVNALITGCC